MKVVHDTIVLFGRSMRHVMRSPETLMEIVVIPIITMLMLVFIFGGAIQTGTGSYVNYMLPGIMLIAIISGTIYTSLRLFNDREKGLLARFHSMPVSRSSILWAHTLTSLVSNAASVVIILIAAYIIGFRSSTGVLEWVMIIAILGIFTLALTWFAIIPGLIAKTTDGVLAFAYPLVFLPFVSSAFVPTETMLPLVRLFVENQPITIVVNAIRSLLSSNPVEHDIFLSFTWCIAIMVFAYIVARIVYKPEIN